MDHRIRTGRRRSFDEPGHAHELTFTCYRRYHFFRADRACAWLAEAIDDARIRLDFALWAFVFMPDHVHLILCPRCPDYRISLILRAIKEPVGRRAIAYLKCEAPEWLPRITRRRGRHEERLFWQSGGGYDRNIAEGRTLFAMIDYVHQNPVRRGLVECAADWTWSSAGWYSGRDRSGLIPDPIPPEWAAP